MSTITAWQVVGARDVTSSIGIKHKGVKIYRKIELEVTQERTVDDLYYEALGHVGHPRTGRMAVDTLGQPWSQDWDGAERDGAGPWIRIDGTQAETGHADRPRSADSEGWLNEADL